MTASAAFLIVARCRGHAACCDVFRIPTFIALALLASVSCNRSASAPEPVAPVQHVAPRAPSAEPAAAVAAEPTPPPPPKEAVPDAPEAPTAAPTEPEKPPIGSPAAAEAPKPNATKVKKRSGRTREIQRTPGNTACIEMYGTCTPPPDQICTSSVLYVDCGQRAQLPSSGEWVHCVCD
jgi:type IV secretory pathway VirB10-like protein